MGRKSREKRERREAGEEYSSPKKIGLQRKSTAEMILLFLIHGATYLMLATPLIVGSRYFFPYVGPKGLYLMALIEIVFFAWLILAFLSPKYRPQKNAVLFAVGAYVLILSIATLFGADPLRSFWSKFERMSGLLMWLHLFAFLVAVISVFKRKDWERFLLVSLGIAVVACFLFFVDTSGSLTAKGGSTLGNSSFLATYLLFNIYFALYLFYVFFQRAKKKIREQRESTLSISKTALVACSFIFMVITLSMSKGQAAIVSCIGGFGLIFLFWLAFQNKRPWIRRIAKAITILGFIVYISAIFLLLYPGTFVQDFYLNFRTESRPLVWQSAWQGFRERPILGWGPQNFGFVFEKNLQPWFIAHDKPNFDQAHNIVMDSLVDVGILGFLAYMSLLGSVFWVLWKKQQRSRLSFWAAAIFSALLIAHFTQNLTVFDMPASFLMFFLALGFVGSLAARGKSSSEEIKIRRVSPVVAIISIVLLGFCLNFFVYKPSLAGQGLIKALLSQSHSQRIEAYEQTMHSSLMGMYQIRTHSAGDLIKRAEKGEAYKQEFDFMSQELEKSLKTSPLDFDSRFALAKIYNAYGMLYDTTKLTRAEEILKDAIQLSPTNQRVYWEMSQTQFLLGRPDESIFYAEQSIAIDPNLAYSHLFYVNLLMIAGKNELALEKAREALESVPESQARRIKPSFKENLEQILGIEDLELDSS